MSFDGFVMLASELQQASLNQERQGVAEGVDQALAYAKREKAVWDAFATHNRAVCYSCCYQ